MNKAIILAAALSGVSLPAMAQDINSDSTSGAAANSGSVSGAESNGNQQSQANIGGNNAGIGSSRSNSDSVSVSDSASVSGSQSASDQTQGQSMGQSQGQTTSVGQTQGQSATNQQGVQTSITFNSTNRKHSYVGTNTPVMLAASSSFSSDYCGGTVSGGASVAPIGVSIGGAAPKFDESCKYLRLAEKAGMLGANYHNMGQPEMSMRAMSLMAWGVCMAGPRDVKQRENATERACLALGLLGSAASPATPPVIEPKTVTPPEAYRADPVPDYSELPPKTPRGEAPVAPGAVARMGY